MCGQRLLGGASHTSVNDSVSCTTLHLSLSLCLSLSPSLPPSLSLPLPPSPSLSLPLPPSPSLSLHLPASRCISLPLSLSLCLSLSLSLCLSLSLPLSLSASLSLPLSLLLSLSLSAFSRARVGSLFSGLGRAGRAQSCSRPGLDVQIRFVELWGKAFGDLCKDSLPLTRSLTELSETSFGSATGQWKTQGICKCHRAAQARCNSQ